MIEKRNLSKPQKPNPPHNNLKSNSSGTAKKPRTNMRQMLMLIWRKPKRKTKKQKVTSPNRSGWRLKHAMMRRSRERRRMRSEENESVNSSK
jgi:hypothetical protein